MKRKERGSVLLASMMACIVMTFMVGTYFTVFGGGLQLLKNGKIIEQAQ